MHQNPELGFDLPITTAYVKKRLEEMGYQPKDICQCGFTVVAGKPDYKTLLIRADMDALPMEETTDLPFKSTNSNSHSCGHDTHTAMALGLAAILKKYENDLEGCVKICFQPAEEPILGAKEMIARGVLEDPHVDAVFGMHTSLPMKAGAIRLLEGPVCASSDIFEIKLLGKGGHGALPEVGVDPINIGAHIVINLQELIAREISATEPVVLTLGSIHSGDAPNVIPNDCTISGTLRAFNPDVRNFAKKRMEEVIQATANMFRGKAEIHYITETPPVVNTPDFAVEMQQYIRDVIGEDCITKGPRIMGSDDFAYYNEQRPGAMFHIGMGTKEEGHTCALHNPGVWFDEKSIAICAGAMANCCVNWLKNHKED